MNDARFELRRDPPRDPDAVGEDRELVARIRAEIAERGPMTFARFMELALYEPGHGYYRRPEAGPGAAGDFLTAPETHPIFGAAVGKLIEEAWQAAGEPDPFVVTEHGAGTGALAAGLLDGLHDAGSPLADAIRYRPLEIEPARISTLRQRLADAGLADRLIYDEPSGVETGAVVANELLDALPVHRVVMRDSLRERYVVVSESGFTEVDGEPSTPALAAHLDAERITLEAGQTTEIPLALDDWVTRAAGSLGRGILVLIDYGAEPEELHGPARRDGSLRAFAHHTVSRDPFVRIGRQDLTTHVDLAAVRRAAARAGLRPVGETTQGELLAASAAGDIVARRLAGRQTTLEAALALRSALARLLDPRKMGGYHVLVFGRAMPERFAPASLRRVRPPR